MPHIHEKIDFTVDAYIVRGNKVLLRYHDKFDLWLAVGGHIELDENPNQAILREVKEEVGLDVTLYDKSARTGGLNNKYKELIPPMFLNIHYINEIHQHCSMVYFATSKSESVMPLEEEDRSDRCIWCTKEDLIKFTELEPTIKFYALEALRILAENN